MNYVKTIKEQTKLNQNKIKAQRSNNSSIWNTQHYLRVSDRHTFYKMCVLLHWYFDYLCAWYGCTSKLKQKLCRKNQQQQLERYPVLYKSRRYLHQCDDAFHLLNLDIDCSHILRDFVDFAQIRRQFQTRSMTPSRSQLFCAIN